MSVNIDDYSKDFEIIAKGPLNSDFMKVTLKKKTGEKNIYKINTLKENIFIYNCIYSIRVYEKNQIISTYI